jgi:dCMP deaminase
MNNDKFFALAEQVASWSKDPSRKIGAIAVGDKKQILSMGFNGFPRGVEDSAERLSDRPTKYKMVVHAEMNAIFNACLNGVSLDGSTMYVVGLPVCNECAKGIIQSGVKMVKMKFVDTPDKWSESWEISRQMFDEAGVSYDIYC